MKKSVLIFVPVFVLSFEASAGCDSSGRCEWDCTPANSTGSCTAVYENNVLTISGDGEMDNYDWSTAPWKSTIAGKVSSIIVEDGITKIGDTAFYKLGSQQIDVALPSSLDTIGTWAFRESYNVQMTLPKGLKSIGSGAFAGVTPRQLEIPSTVTSIYEFNFAEEGWDLVLNANSNLVLNSQVARDVGGRYHDISITCKGDIDVCATMSANVKNALINKGKTFNLKDADGNMVNSCDGSGCVKYIYDDSGNLLRQNKYDTQGLFVKSFGQNADGSYFYYDEDGQMIYNTDGSYNLYDKDGNIIGYKGKRIYTVQEANKVSKPTGNRVSIRYK